MPKEKTLPQVEAMQRKAVRFAEDVLDDDELADELDSLSPEEYAERKGVRIVTNPQEGRKGLMPRRKNMPEPTKAQLMERIAELEEENEALYEERQTIRDLLGEDEEEEDEEDEDEDEDED